LSGDRKRHSRSKLLKFFTDLPTCPIDIEACPTSHHWSRKLAALGHTVTLMPLSYVKAYVKRSKNNANNAAAICEGHDRRCDLCRRNLSSRNRPLCSIAALSTWAVSAQCCQTRSEGVCRS